MCVPLPHEQDTNSADTAYGIACLTILADRVKTRLAECWLHQLTAGYSESNHRPYSRFCRKVPSHYAILGDGVDTRVRSARA